MVNILVLVTFKVFPPQMGGQKGVAFFYKYLKQFAHILMATSKNNNTVDFIVTETLYENKKIYLNLFEIKNLKKIIKANNIDVVLVEHSYPAWIAYLLKKQTGTPFIIHSHNIEALRFKQMKKWWWKWYLKYEKWIHQQANFNFFISDEDKTFAIENFKVSENKSVVIPYGIEAITTNLIEKSALKNQLSLPDKLIFLFNGTLNYKPNKEAVNCLVHNIVPLIKKHINNFEIVICGKDAEQSLLDDLNKNQHFKYKGFVENIDDYYKSCDLFLNPVINDSGVKTKVIEALANNCKVISFASGAAGVPINLCHQHLIIIKDYDWEGFAKAVINQIGIKSIPVSEEFKKYFNWNNIAENAFEKIKQVVNKQ